MKADGRARTVIVTGAASGVGRELVRMFRAEDDRVIAVDLSVERLVQLERDYPGVETLAVDISSTDGARAIFDVAGGRVDVLCNNAGIADLYWVDELTEERWDRVMDVNLKAPFLLTQLAVPIMVEAGSGSIVNTASISADQGGRAGAAYTASKAGLVGLTKNVAATFGPLGIRCNAVCPGTIATSIQESMDEPSERALRFATRDRDKPPAAAPEEIAAAIHFLASPAASRVNGAALVVDGGWTAY